MGVKAVFAQVASDEAEVVTGAVEADLRGHGVEEVEDEER